MLYLKIISLFISLLALIVSSKISINIGLATPITLQTYAIGLIILLASPNIAAVSIFTYVVLGILGVPVFSGGSAGISVLTGATGGYIVGFLVCAVLFYCLKTSFIKTSNLNLISLFGWMILLHIVIVFCGYIRLGMILGYIEALYKGVLPLVIPAIIKSIMIVLSYAIIQKILVPLVISK